LRRTASVPEENMNETPTIQALAGAVVLALLLGGCGGSNCSKNPAPPGCVAPPTPWPFGKTVIAEGRLSGLAPNRLTAVPFRLPTVGLLDATVDWALTTDNVDVYITYGSCTVDQFSTCHFVAYSESTSAKPELVGVSQVRAGEYTLFMGNRGPAEESVSYQIFLTIVNEYSPPPME